MSSFILFPFFIFNEVIRSRSFAQFIIRRMSATNNNSSNNTSSSIIFSDSSVSWVKQFWIMLFSNILSIICCLFVVFHLLSDQTLRRALHNHVIIVVLILSLFCEWTDIPWLLIFYRWGVVWQRTLTFCLVWKYIDITIYVATSKLVAWASIERHILIFHDKWVSTKKKRVFVHYIPLVAIVGSIMRLLFVYFNIFLLFLLKIQQW
jgi:hypothetical protein